MDHNPAEGANGDVSAPPAPDRRRRWLVGAAIALILFVVVIVIMARGGGSKGHGDMPGMDMNGMGRTHVSATSLAV